MPLELLQTRHQFFRPGHGAPTLDVRKKRFTEHQLDKLKQQANGGGFGWDGDELGHMIHQEPIQRQEDLQDMNVSNLNHEANVAFLVGM